MKQVTQVITILGLLLIAISFAAAEGKVSLKMEVMEEVEVINQDGEKEIQYIAPESVVPGDVVLYTIHYHNQADKPAEAVVITNQIPEHMKFLSESKHGSDATIKFSINSGRSFHTPDKLFVTTEDGDKRPATAQDYTNIEWQLNHPLDPGGKGIVGYRSILE